MKYGLSDSAAGNIRAVLARHPQVEQAILYGSRARGNYRNGFDIDLTLLGGADLTLNVLHRILDEPDDLLLPWTIDLSIFNDISDPDMIDHIQRAGVVFYKKASSPPKQREKALPDVTLREGRPVFSSPKLSAPGARPQRTSRTAPRTRHRSQT